MGSRSPLEGGVPLPGNTLPLDDRGEVLHVEDGSKSTETLREMEQIERFRSLLGEEKGVKVAEPLGVWRGILFLEFFEGLTLNDIIAIHRSRSGMLLPSLELVVTVLASLHRLGESSHVPPEIETEVKDTLEYVQELTMHGVLRGEPEVATQLKHWIKSWAKKPSMRQQVPTLTHGDATTTNFVFPADDEILAIDWERMKVADPAGDLGRLMAEVAYSVEKQGGNESDVTDLMNYIFTSYCHVFSGGEDQSGFRERVQF